MIPEFIKTHVIETIAASVATAIIASCSIALIAQHKEINSLKTSNSISNAKLLEKEKALQNELTKVNEKEKALQNELTKVNEKEKALQNELTKTIEKEKALQNELTKTIEKEKTLQDAQNKLDEAQQKLKEFVFTITKDEPNLTTYNTIRNALITDANFYDITKVKFTENSDPNAKYPIKIYFGEQLADEKRFKNTYNTINKKTFKTFLLKYQELKNQYDTQCKNFQAAKNEYDEQFKSFCRAVSEYIQPNVNS